MSVHAAIDKACADVGIVPPRRVAYGKWLLTDTLDGGKSGKGDGRVIVNAYHVSAWNWRTGAASTVKIGGDQNEDPIQRRKIARQIDIEKEKQSARSRRAAKTAQKILDAAVSSTHPYLSGKGFPNEPALVVGSDVIAKIAGDYLVPDGGQNAIVMPARRGSDLTSVQLIWEDGTKKFLSGGAIDGASCRIAKGTAYTWLCEGLATGLSLRLALKGLKRSDTVLCCFSAGNVAAVARSLAGQCFIVTDNDKPQDVLGGLGAGEYFARSAGRPYLMPPEHGDINDMHMRHGIFAVQKTISQFLRGVRM